MSPHLINHIPYLCRHYNSNRSVKKFLGYLSSQRDLYISSAWSGDQKKCVSSAKSRDGMTSLCHRDLSSTTADLTRCDLFSKPRNLKPLHRLLTSNVVHKAAGPKDCELQDCLSDFRAIGPCYNVKPKPQIIAKQLPSPCQPDTSDCLKSLNHQKFLVNFSSYTYDSAKTSVCCVQPWVVPMHYYRHSDISIGEFLERYCFRSSYQCPNNSCCQTSWNHVRRFCHNNTCIQVLLKKLEVPIAGHANNVLMWSWCKICKQVSPVMAMSADTSSMSFAKYLELRFHGDVYQRRPVSEAITDIIDTSCASSSDQPVGLNAANSGPRSTNADGAKDEIATSTSANTSAVVVNKKPAKCEHSFNKDHFQYFGLGHIVVSFKYCAITLHDIVLPPICIDVTKRASSATHIRDSLSHILKQGISVFQEVIEYLNKAKNDNNVKVIDEYIATAQMENEEFEKKTTILFHKQMNVKGDILEWQYDLENSVVEMKRNIAEMVCRWNQRLVDAELAPKKIDKKKQKKLSNKKVNSSMPCTDGADCGLYYQIYSIH